MVSGLWPHDCADSFLIAVVVGGDGDYRTPIKNKKQPPAGILLLGHYGVRLMGT